MFKMNYRSKSILAGVAILALLSACGGSGSSSSTQPNSAGTLSFTPNTNIQVTNGSLQQVLLSLDNSRGVSGQAVSLNVTNPEVASIAPKTCYVSSGSAPSASCVLTIYGKANGSTSLIAQAPGYESIILPATVGAASVYGYIAVEDANGKFESNSVNLSYLASSSPPYQVTVTGKLVNSSGITAESNMFLGFKATGANAQYVTGLPNQCQVYTSPVANQLCVMKFTISKKLTSPLLLTASMGGAGTVSHTYNSVSIKESADTTPQYGIVSISSQSGNAVPIGMKAPIFVGWDKSTTIGTISLTLTSSNPSVIQFYHYESGALIGTPTENCTLTYTGDSKTDILSCGYGVYALAKSGSTQIQGVVNSSTISGHTFSVAPYTISVAVPDVPIRSIVFTNNSTTQNIYVGVTGGAAAAYVGPFQAAVPPQQVTANSKPGSGSYCGPNNPMAACPVGSTCLQGGQTPGAGTPFFCYWDQPRPVGGAESGYLINQNGGRTTLEISGSSRTPDGIIWSGNTYARTNCDPKTGICENADCHGMAGGLACGPGTGAAPGVNTLAELTFQEVTLNDFYDVSIINGANFAAEFGPADQSLVSQSNAYSCGRAGSLTPQSGGWSSANQTVGGLPAANWVVQPSTNSVYPFNVSNPDAATYYHWVESNTTTACSSDSSCQLIESDYVCGYIINTAYNNVESAINQGNNSSYNRVCGKQIAWLTADSIWGLNESVVNTAPFNFLQSWLNPYPGALSPVSVGDLQLCINDTFSAYVESPTPTNTAGNPVLACGGVSWNTYMGGITRPSQPVITLNQNWMDNVLPSISWLKQACPTCYTYPFDDMSSTFTCPASSKTDDKLDYVVNFSDLGKGPI